MSKVDRRITKSQEAIKIALIELMTEKSFDHITIKEISERANVNRGTIYLHYLDKFDLLEKIMEEHINNMGIFVSRQLKWTGLNRLYTAWNTLRVIIYSFRRC